MNTLTPSQAIHKALEKFPTARTIPVHNVAHWGTNKLENAANFALDSRLYSWKGDTLKALRLVLKLQNKL